MEHESQKGVTATFQFENRNGIFVEIDLPNNIHKKCSIRIQRVLEGSYGARELIASPDLTGKSFMEAWNEAGKILNDMMAEKKDHRPFEG